MCLTAMRALASWAMFATVPLTALAAEPPARPATVDVPVRLTLKSPAELKASDVKLAVFPRGKRCAFTFFGCRDPKTISVLTKLGFRTTVYCSPRTSPPRLKALESAGADVGINIWGGKGTYGSHIGANTVQEAFDAVATSRIVMGRSCKGPLACGAIGGHYSIRRFPIDRNPDKGTGSGFAYHDSNYLILTDNKPYMIYLGRQRDRLLAHRENFDNRIDSRRVPNEIIYYQILANQFRGTLRRVQAGQIVRFSLRDFRAPDLRECAEVIGPFGSHELIWHASEAEIGANEYVRHKVHVKAARMLGGGEAEIVLGIEEDTFCPFLLTPLPLALPAGLGVEKAVAGGVPCGVVAAKEATCVDVPLRAGLTNGCRMTLESAAPDMSIPDEMPVTLTITNTSGRPIVGAALRWAGTIGLSVAGGDDAPFDLPAGSTRHIQAVVRTAAGARFGIAPFQAILTASVAGEQRLFMEGFEVAVAPRLRLAMDPSSRVPLFKGRSQHFLVHIDNHMSTRPGGPPDTLISHKAGPCKGTVGFDLPPGMTAVPAEQPFELGRNERKTLVFKVRNDAWGEEPVMVSPVIRFAGESQPLHVPFPGTTILRDEAKIGYKPLDEKGLLVYSAWDDNTRGGRFTRSVGAPGSHYFPGHHPAYNNEGVKGWCMNSQRVCQIHDPFKNIDYHEGTVCMWVRKDPFVRNENTYVPKPAETAGMLCGRSNRGETLFTVGLVQRISGGDSGLTLRRFRSWKGADGYLQLTYQLMGRRVVCCQAGPFNWTEQWRHVAMLWSVKDRRLELYLDGKLAAKADPGQGEWYVSPWDPGRAGTHGLQLITSDHGCWCGTCRDEVYIYNRALKPGEILTNRDLVPRQQ